MKRITPIFVLCMMLFAGEVSPDMAANAARTHLEIMADLVRQENPDLNGQPVFSDEDIVPERKEFTGELLGYVIHLQPAGYIFVSPMTEIRPIIMYSFSQNYIHEDSQLNKPRNIVLYDMETRINAIPYTDFQVIVENERLWKQMTGPDAPFLRTFEDMEVIGPLLDTRWGQSAPYWDRCPMDPETGDRCVTGCVATALAQQLNFFEWPSSVELTDIESYNSTRTDPSIYLDAPSASMDTIDYNGDGVHPTVETLQDLMLACGVSVRMGYSSTASGAWLRKHHYMNKWRFGLTRDYDGDDEGVFEKMAAYIMTDRPATMAISSSDGGHQINVDGYNTETEDFHLNYGWDGSSDGWYSLPHGMPAGFTTVTNVNIDFEFPRYHTIRVPDDYPSIQMALDSAYSMDTVIVADGVWTGDDNRDLKFGGKAVYLRSANGPDICIIDAEATSDDRHRVFTVDHGEGRGCVIDGFTITGGVIATGPGVYLSGSSPIVRNCIITGNHGYSYSGGVFAKNGHPIIENTIITDNYGYRGGGLWAELGHFGLINSVIINNRARFGGGIHVYRKTKIAILNSIIRDNTAEDTFDEIYIQYRADEPCTLLISHTDIEYSECRPEPNAGVILWGPGILDVDPEFDGEGFAPVAESPVVRAGDSYLFLTVAYQAPTYGINGIERGDAPDMGAYQRESEPFNHRPDFWKYSEYSFVRRGETFEMEFAATDPDADLLEFALSGPTGMYIDDGRIIWEPESTDIGINHVYLTASDGELADSVDLIVEVVGGYCGQVTGVWETGVYEITCYVYVPEDDSLIIGPGVSVLFNGHHSMEVYGLLKAKGTPFSPIQFTSLDSDLTDSTGGFNSIRFLNSAPGCSLVSVIVEDGNANTHMPFISGGGIYMSGSDVTILDSEIRNNRAKYFGGGIYSLSSQPYIANCIVTSNNSSDDGGGIALYTSGGRLFGNTISSNRSGDVGGGLMIASSSTALVDSNSFISNRAYNHGAGMYLNSQTTIYGNLFTGNIAERYHGGGMYIYGSNDAVVAYNKFEGNDADERGGGLFIYRSQSSILFNKIYENTAGTLGGGISCERSSPEIEGNRIAGNEAEKGGGIRAQTNSHPLLKNNVIHDNTAHEGGGIWASSGTELSVYNNTIYSNRAVLSGGSGIYMTDTCFAGVFNTIMWDNNFPTLPAVGEIFAESSECSVFVGYSVIDPEKCYGEGEIGFGERIINSDPLIIDSLYLSPYSPCVDSGVMDYMTPWDDIFLAAWVDVDSQPRPMGRAWDIGADESPYTAAITEAQARPEANSSLGLYPNPFNAAVEISVATDHAEIEITDIRGRLVKEFHDVGSVIWRPERDVPTGIYMVRVKSGGKTASQRAILIR